MERQVWLAEHRAALVAGYDADAATYGDDEYPWDMQRDWVARVLRLIPPRRDGAGCAVRHRQVLSDGGGGRSPGRGR